MWTATACLFISCLLYCIGGSVGRKDTGYSGRKERRRGFFSSNRSNSVKSQKNEQPTSTYA
jgi:S-adenosylmethionine synthetase